MKLVVANRKQRGYGNTVFSNLQKKHRPMVILVDMRVIERRSRCHNLDDDGDDDDSGLRFCHAESVGGLRSGHTSLSHSDRKPRKPKTYTRNRYIFTTMPSSENGGQEASAWRSYSITQFWVEGS